MHCVIIGTGYVGLVTGVILANREIKISCIEQDIAKLTKIQSGIAPIYEADLDSLLQNAVQNKLLQAFSNIAKVNDKVDIVFITVGTPSNQNGIDLSYIKKAAEDIGIWLKQQSHYVVIVVKSTVTPTTTDTLVRNTLEQTSNKRCGTDFGLCMNPEFLREGQAVYDATHPDRIVIGEFDTKSGQVLEEVYTSFKTDIIHCNLRTAEMIKYVNNSFLATSISFTNEMANICAAIGDIDIKDVMHGVHLDSRLNPLNAAHERTNPGYLKYLEAGCGYGGSCFPKDVRALINFTETLGVDIKILPSVVQTNNSQPNKILNLLDLAYPEGIGISVAVLGIAFKPGTDDIRESPAFHVLTNLLKRGCNVKAYDPIITKLPDGYEKISLEKNLKDAIVDVDAAIILTAWPEFNQLINRDFTSKMRKLVIIDGRRMLDKREFAAHEYFGIGNQVVAL